MMLLVSQRAELDTLTCASKLGGEGSRGAMQQLKGASEAPSDGLRRGRRGRLTSFALTTRTSRKRGQKGGGASQRRRGLFAFSVRAVLHGDSTCIELITNLTMHNYLVLKKNKTP